MAHKRTIKDTSIPRLARAGGLELIARHAMSGLYAGRHHSHERGSSVDFADHRPYQEGDDLRVVDWKAFARSDRLLIRRYYDERQLPLVLLLDGSASMSYGTPEKFSHAKLLAAILGLLALDQGDHVRLISTATNPVQWYAPCTAEAAGARLIQQLEDVRANGSSDIASALVQVGERLERRSMVVLFSDLLVDPLPLGDAAATLAARGHELAALQVLDRSELSLPEDWSNTVLADPEGIHADLTCDTTRVKEGYDRAIATHLDQCRQSLAAGRAELVTCITDENAAQSIGRWLQYRRRK